MEIIWHQNDDENSYLASNDVFKSKCASQWYESSDLRVYGLYMKMQGFGTLNQT